MAKAALTLAIHVPDPERRAACVAFAAAQRWRVHSLPAPHVDHAAWRSTPHDVALIAVGSAGLAAVMQAFAPVCAERSLVLLLDDGEPAALSAAMLAGADDAQPAMIDQHELHARLFALARRRALARGMLRCDELAVNLVEREVRRDGQLITMPMREFGLIARLAMSPDQPVSRSDLLRAVWRIDFDPGTNRIDVHVSRLRRRIDDGHAHAMLRTVKGLGYALVSREGAAMFA